MKDYFSMLKSSVMPQCPAGLLITFLLKEHVDHMEQPKLLKELIYQIKDNKLLSNCGNVARTSGINGGENNKAWANDEVTCPVPLEGTTKEDIMQMVEATAMV